MERVWQKNTSRAGVHQGVDKARRERVSGTSRGSARASNLCETYDLKDYINSKLFMDQRGRFPVTSYKGNQFVMVMFEAASNNTLLEARRSGTSGEMVRAYQTLVDRFKEKCMLPKLRILDNECSTEFKTAIQHNGMKFQLVPPNDH